MGCVSCLHHRFTYVLLAIAVKSRALEGRMSRTVFLVGLDIYKSLLAVVDWSAKGSLATLRHVAGVIPFRRNPFRRIPFPRISGPRAVSRLLPSSAIFDLQ